MQIITYKWLSSIAAKGEDSARWHFVIAQQVRDAFVKHGLMVLPSVCFAMTSGKMSMNLSSLMRLSLLILMV
uniref:Peptidase S74 domain-containing protein n=1 Tax=Escherichia virus LS2 TaxID=2743776 RepID=A0A7D5FT26_9CAUD